MGIYRPLIERAQGANKPASGITPSKRIITPATVITSTRIPFALKAAEELLHGKKNAAGYVAAMAASDMEGIPARWFDKHHPEWEIGSTELGAKADVAADALGAFIVASAALFAPNVSKPAKGAVALTLGRETMKTVVFMAKNKEFREALREAEMPAMNLVLPVDIEGKETMVEEFDTLFFASLTSDLVDRPILRAGATGLAVVHGVSGFRRGMHIDRDIYHPMADERIAQVQAGDFSFLETAA